MSFYSRMVLPRLTNFAMRRRPVQKYRRELVPAAQGRVLEVASDRG